FTRIIGAGTLSGAAISPSASIVRPGPDGPSGRHTPRPARSVSVRMPPSSEPARWRLSFTITARVASLARSEGVALAVTAQTITVNQTRARLARGRTAFIDILQF